MPKLTDYECHDGAKCNAADKAECESKCRRLKAQKSEPTDADRIEWLNGAIFMPKWNGVLGKGSEVNWTIAGDWRHTCARMTGNDFRAAIDAAMASGKSAS